MARRAYVPGERHRRRQTRRREVLGLLEQRRAAAVEPPRGHADLAHELLRGWQNRGEPRRQEDAS